MMTEQTAGAAALDNGGGTPAPSPAPSPTPSPTPAPSPTPSPSPRDWMANLPEDLRVDPTLARYETPEAQLRGHLEAHRVAKGARAIPAADAPPEAWQPVWDALGVPKEAAGYEFKMPEGAEPSPLVEAFRETAFGLKMPPAMAQGAVDFYNAQMQAQIDADAKTLTDFKAELGTEYDATVEKAKQGFKAMGLDGEFADKMAILTNSAALIKGFAAIADKVGEHQRVGGEEPGDPLNGVPDAQAEAKLQTLQRDKSWREKYNNGDALVKAEYARLLAAAQRHATRGM